MLIVVIAFVTVHEKLKKIQDDEGSSSPTPRPLRGRGSRGSRGTKGRGRRGTRGSTSTQGGRPRRLSGRSSSRRRVRHSRDRLEDELEGNLSTSDEEEDVRVVYADSDDEELVEMDGDEDEFGNITQQPCAWGK